MAPNYNSIENELCLVQIKKYSMLLRFSRLNRQKRKSRLRTQILEEYCKERKSLLQSYLKMFPVPRQRLIWAKERSGDWWNRIVSDFFNDEDFNANFRMSRSSYLELCNELYNELKPSDNAVRQPIPVETIVAIGLYRIASCSEMRIIGNQFGVHTSTARKCTIKFVMAVCKVMMRKYIYFPCEEECKHICLGFEKLSGIPNIIGAIDVCHIPITAPSNEYSDFINRKGWTSVVLQGIVDCNYRFRDIVCKHPGGRDAATVFKDSEIYRNAAQIIPNGAIELGSNVLPYCIVGNPAYPLTPWLLKNYPQGCSAEQESCNVYCNKARIVVENAFRKLKGRWRILRKKIEMHYSLVPYIVAACCVLHNFVEIRNEQFKDSWLEEIVNLEPFFPRPHQTESSEKGSNKQKHVRDILCGYLSTNSPLLQQRNL